MWRLDGVISLYRSWTRAAEEGMPVMRLLQ
jgi:hypothetical protein